MLLPVLGVFTNHRVDLMKKKKKKRYLFTSPLSKVEGNF